MGLVELFLIGVGLSMDAFAVSICKGLSVPKVKFKEIVIVGLWFGLFQAGMPLLGYWLGASFETFVTSVDHWIAFFLLGAIGINMIREARKPQETCNNHFDANTMFPLAVATSIDALAVGITFAFLNVNIWIAILIIGITTFVLSMIGFKVGNAFGSKYRSTAEIVGGIILILMGIKILVEHLGLLG